MANETKGANLHVLVGGYLIVAVGHFPSEVPNECFRHVSRKSRSIKIKMRPLNHNYIIFDQEKKFAPLW